ncbi:ZPR1 zinc finger domain-containing protein [Methanocaldococcus infernus]|uniref:ZPR1-related zinc finger protein n=1 Tax=Methanocaldococcus infernus (strain DSM 11812 / JCM 15783 / ME) TaxID=573063 RepID=D5VRJ9_METIM|nr:ZPR1 zinc finger domain-containing protein [Methanocaldococcus infernus]ADG13202.1 ZPR1-related zinc finger protein [Methanocaldococcus infernus ME]
MEESRLDCPVCKGKGTLKVINNKINIPYFGEVLETTMICENCGFRRCDIFPLEVREPSRYKLKVKGEKDLCKRVIRSSTGYIEIPELGVEITPGPLAEGFVSNVEGVLDRVDNILQTLIRWAETEEQKEKAEKLRERIEKVKKGEEEVTLVLTDPLGHSAIIGEGVEEEILDEEEAKKLRGDILIFEKKKEEK